MTGSAGGTGLGSCSNFDSLDVPAAKTRSARNDFERLDMRNFVTDTRQIRLDGCCVIFRRNPS